MNESVGKPQYDIEQTCDCANHAKLREFARLRDLTRPIRTEGDKQREKVRRSL